MSILRKACRNCTASKRKCAVQLPKCVRCAQRGLECMYDLDHLSAPTGKPEESPTFTFNTPTCDSPGYCVLKTLRFRSPDIDPAICSPGNEDSLEIIRLGYQSVPDLIRAGKPSVFIHPKLQIQSNYNHLAIFGETGQSSLNYESLKRLVQIDLKAVPVEEALTALQALLIYLATFLFSSHPAEQADAEAILGVLSEWTQIILLCAQSRMSRKQSLWQEWLFGESVRRSIIMSYGLVMALTSFKYGYCSHWLFVESLPFDSRAGLWVAESPQAWIAAAGVRTGEEVGERLNSVHEFGESLTGSHPNFYGDMFLILLAYSHNGCRKKRGLSTCGN